MTRPFRGVYAIAQTPFDGDNNLLWDDFERECDFIARSGAHGFVWPVMASEFTVVSYPERMEGMRRAVDVVAGRIPAVIGVADTTQDAAVRLAAEAGRVGADAVIAMPPWATKMGDNDAFRGYYRAIADAAGIPVFIQNCDPPLGSSLAATFLADLCREIPLVQYVKEEKHPIGHSVSELIAAAGDSLKGVFSGASCYWLISEHKRGAAGNMPGCFIPDVDARVWDLLEEGKVAEAREVHKAKMVLEYAVRGMPPRMGKKMVLVRRGVFSHAAGRYGSSMPLDETDLAELDYAMGCVEPYFAV